MRFDLSSSLLTRLREVQEQRGNADELTEREDAFLLDPGLGPGRYLTSDGRVLTDPQDWDGGPVYEAADDEAIIALVVGAKKMGIAELLTLIPVRPDDAQTCPVCEGTRWVAPANDFNGQLAEFVCPFCAGRGWAIILPRLTTTEYATAISAKRHAIVLFDAPWNGTGRPLRPRFAEAAKRFRDQIAFAEVNIDKEAGLAEELKLGNVPTIAFYRHGQLVKHYIGASQDVVRQAELLIAGEPIPYLEAKDHPPVRQASGDGRKRTWYSRFWRWLFSP